ncbi:hypothetical protein ACTXT7_010775 [Hymenolepis weldensis]
MASTANNVNFCLRYRKSHLKGIRVKRVKCEVASCMRKIPEKKAMLKHYRQDHCSSGAMIYIVQFPYDVIQTRFSMTRYGEAERTETYLVWQNYVLKSITKD